MGRRHLTTAITMLVLVGILVLGVVLGVNTLLAPLPGDSNPAADASPTCTTETVKKGERIKASQVQVSVFNAGTRAGLADKTLGLLAARGFKKGSVGNAPSSAKVKKVQVWTMEKHDPAAKLVARQFGRSTVVHVTKSELGPGVDVIVGNGFRKLVKSKKVIVVHKSSSVCVPVSASPSTDEG
jgi:hypothetical protein